MQVGSRYIQRGELRITVWRERSGEQTVSGLILNPN